MLVVIAIVGLIFIVIAVLSLLLSYFIEESDADINHQPNEVHNPNQANPWSEE